MSGRAKVILRLILYPPILVGIAWLIFCSRSRTPQGAARPADGPKDRAPRGEQHLEPKGRA